MSAIFYPVDNITPIMQTIVGFNPVYAYIQFARECMMYLTVPEASCWLKVILWGVGMFVLGYRVFKDKENAVMQKV